VLKKKSAMKKILTLALICLFAICNAQKPPGKFGSVSKEEVEMKTYEQDTSAAAVKLLDYGESLMSYNQSSGFTLTFDRLIRIKILKKEGYDWANFQIPLYHQGSRDEKVISLKGITYNLIDGKVVETKLRKDGIFDEKRDENVNLRKVTMPDVQVGSVIELAYSVSSEFWTNLEDWSFQTSIPVVWSEYRLRIPEYFTYDKYMQGYIGLAEKEETSVPITFTLDSRSNDILRLNENRMRYAAQNVPAFKAEPFITTASDYLSQINFELAYVKLPNQAVKTYMGNWDDIAKNFWEDAEFGGQIKGNNFLKSTVTEITAGLTKPEQKIGAIYNYLKQNVSWDGTYRRYVSTPLRKVLDEKKGSTAEINFLLASMLEKAGFEVYPVLLSTRNHGFLRESIPVASQFNNVICLVKLEGKQLLLDASVKYLPAGILPQNCLNGNGLVVSKDRASWVKLETSTRSKVLVSTEFTISEDEILTGKIGYERTGYDAQKYRYQYFVDGEEKYLENLNKAKQWEISASSFTDAKEIEVSFKEQHQFELSDRVTSAGDMYYIDPFITDKLEENIFKLENRQYPVNFGSPFEKIYMAKITIPEGYEIDELPQSKVFMLPENGARFIYSASQIGNNINIMSNLSVNKSIFNQIEYPNLREFYNQVVAKQAEMIVLKKK
jgi:hypothetical protein